MPARLMLVWTANARPEQKPAMPAKILACSPRAFAARRHLSCSLCSRGCHLEDDVFMQVSKSAAILAEQSSIHLAHNHSLPFHFGCMMEFPRMLSRTRLFGKRTNN